MAVIGNKLQARSGGIVGALRIPRSQYEMPRTGIDGMRARTGAPALATPEQIAAFNERLRTSTDG